MGAGRMARLLTNCGLGRGQVVAQLMENSSVFFDALWAAHDHGMYFTPLGTLLTAPELAHILRDSEAAVLVTSRALQEKAHAAAALSPIVRRVLVVDGDDREALLQSEPLARGRSQGALLLYSSGTTGVPKGIKPPLPDLSPEEPPALPALLMKLYGVDSSTVYLSTAPLYHTAPLKWNMAIQMAGGTSVLMGRFDAERALALMERYSVTHSQWVPTMFQRLLRLPEAAKKRDMAAHRVAVHAAAPCPPATKRAMIDWWGPIIHEYYAGTESNGLTTLDSAEWLAHPGSVGRCVRGALHIMTPDGETELPEGEPGLIYFESSSHFTYHNDPAKTEAGRNSRGWTTIGDIGFVDREGYLYLTDRRDDVIISGGVNIYPQEIEKLLAAHPAVADCAVIGAPNDDFGEEVKAIVELAQATHDPATLLIEWLAPQLAPYKMPRSWEFVDALPRLPTGKLLKRKLKERHWAGGSAAAALAGTVKPIGDG